MRICVQGGTSRPCKWLKKILSLPSRCYGQRGINCWSSTCPTRHASQASSRRASPANVLQHQSPRTASRTAPSALDTPSAASGHQGCGMCPHPLQRQAKSSASDHCPIPSHSHRSVSAWQTLAAGMFDHLSKSAGKVFSGAPFCVTPDDALRQT
jgi:hypothetical protein